MRKLAIALLCLLLLAAPAAAELQTFTGRASVLDADTIEIHGQRFRFDGSDAVESGQSCERDGKQWACGREAAFALADFIGERPVTCRQTTERRSWARIIARCYVGDVDLGAWTVAQGWAVAYRRFSRDYVPLEDQARAARRGIWAGAFQVPEDFRREKAMRSGR